MSIARRWYWVAVLHVLENCAHLGAEGGFMSTVATALCSCEVQHQLAMLLNESSVRRHSVGICQHQHVFGLELQGLVLTVNLDNVAKRDQVVR